ncbi:MAG: TROVE domain-containing protein [Capsulimonadaceae bacterium]
MANTYLKNLIAAPSTQGDRSRGRADEVQNHDGAFVFAVDDRTRMERFLILGSEGGTYYVDEHTLTKDNAEATMRYIAADGLAAVRLIADISAAGRAAKNDPALFALALAISFGDVETRNAAARALPKVARTGTHLFHFAEYVDGMRGWGKGLRKAVSNWYVHLRADGPALSAEAVDEAIRRVGTDVVRDLAYQVVKYPQRDGWSHRDLLRMAHVQAREQDSGIGGAGGLGRVSESHNILFGYIVDGWPGVGAVPHPDRSLQLVWAAERAKADISEPELLDLITTYGLPMEAIPTGKRSAAVYETVLMAGGSGVTFMLRNLGNLSKHGVLATAVYNDARQKVLATLTSKQALKKARVHPLAVLTALNTYRSGSGVRGSGAWPVVADVVDALEQAFYLAFDTIEPSGARFVLGIDVSMSMACGRIAGLPGITPNVAAATMAMVTRRVENCVALMGFAHEFRDLGIDRTDSLEAATRKTQTASFGSTDCALPITWATRNEVEADVFVVYTDSETNTFTSQKPYVALDAYRNKMGIDAKLISVAMTPGFHTIADPTDMTRHMNVVGFDTSAPGVIADFARRTPESRA